MDAASTLSEPEAARTSADPATVARARAAAAAVEPRSRPSALRGVARRLVAYLRPHAGTLITTIVLFFASSALDPLVPALFKWLLDNGFKPDAAFPLWAVPVVIVGLFAIRGALAFGGAYLFARATADAVLALRTDLIGAVMRADASLFSHLSPGVAANRVITDPNNAVGSLGGALTSVLRDGTTVLALFAYLLYLNWWLTLVSLLTIPLLAIVVRKVQARVLEVSGRTYESQVRLIGIVDDIARAWRVVRTFDAGAFESARFADEARRLRRATMKTTTAGALMTPLTQVVASAGVAVIVTVALIEAGRGGATVGDFVAFVTTLLMTISPLRHLTDVTQPIVGGLVQARACFDLIDTPAEPDPGTRDLDRARGDIRLEQVDVVYPGSERPALAGVDLQVAPGRTIALVGPSGAGKTTVINALLGFVAPAAGRILIDGIELQALRKASLRRQFAVVSQDIVLFDGSIAQNVAYAQPMDRQRVEQCLEAAHLRDFVHALPDGVETRIGTNGSRLSGGQRQRLAIARALYKDASVWIFDEATSALDSESERVVQASIDRWRGEKALIVIAHRLSTVRGADVIYVLGDGRLLESGRHETLIAQGGLYAGMVRAQVVA